ncbi:hypothetical protein KJ652_06535 [Patescibacteria group bacterium]|nr:hypothetical protein [Patescibacteria group bacterium]MBU1124208.1 hypothetical protein [Patescibacteria group bacterium]MBU1911582.1 hypothetical protein [Patescibacteria group bacterium]
MIPLLPLWKNKTWYPKKAHDTQSHTKLDSINLNVEEQLGLLNIFSKLSFDELYQDIKNEKARYSDKQIRFNLCDAIILNCMLIIKLVFLKEKEVEVCG